MSMYPQVCVCIDRYYRLICRHCWYFVPMLQSNQHNILQAPSSPLITPHSIVPTPLCHRSQTHPLTQFSCHAWCQDLSYHSCKLGQDAPDMSEHGSMPVLNPFCLNVLQLLKTDIYFEIVMLPTWSPGSCMCLVLS